MAKKNTKNLDAAALKICENARTQLILNHPFVGRLGVQITFVPVRDCRIHTIATNGKVIYINPQWVCSMPPVTMKGWIAHTIWTAALCHSFRRGNFEPGKFDLASDLEIYTLLRAEEVPMIKKPDFYEMFPKHLPVEKIAAQLPNQKFYRYSNSDVHLYSCGTISIPENLPGEEKESHKDNPHQFPPDGTLNYEGKIEADCECDPAIREVWRQRIIEAGQMFKMTYGSLPGELAELVNSFAGNKTNRIQLLRKHLSFCTGGEANWLPPAKRFVWQKMYLPSHKNPKLEIVVAVDTSGSINEDTFQKIFSDIYNIVKGFPNYKLTLIQCDCVIQNVQEFSPQKPFHKNMSLDLYGRGGTDFTPVFEYIKEKKISPKILLYYTDGDGSYPENKPQYPVIWLMTSNSTIPPWGKIIKLEEE